MLRGRDDRGALFFVEEGGGRKRQEFFFVGRGWGKGKKKVTSPLSPSTLSLRARLQLGSEASLISHLTKSQSRRTLPIVVRVGGEAKQGRERNNAREWASLASHKPSRSPPRESRECASGEPLLSDCWSQITFLTTFLLFPSFFKRCFEALRSEPQTIHMLPPCRR